MVSSTPKSDGSETRGKRVERLIRNHLAILGMDTVPMSLADDLYRKVDLEIRRPNCQGNDRLQLTTQFGAKRKLKAYLQYLEKHPVRGASFYIEIQLSGSHSCACFASAIRDVLDSPKVSERRRSGELCGQVMVISLTIDPATLLCHSQLYTQASRRLEEIKTARLQAKANPVPGYIRGVTGQNVLVKTNDGRGPFKCYFRDIEDPALRDDLTPGSPGYMRSLDGDPVQIALLPDEVREIWPVPQCLIVANSAPTQP